MIDIVDKSYVRIRVRVCNSVREISMVPQNKVGLFGRIERFMVRV